MEFPEESIDKPARQKARYDDKKTMHDDRLLLTGNEFRIREIEAR